MSEQNSHPAQSFMTTNEASAGRYRRAGSVSLAAFLLVVEALYQSADACPPLKSAVGAITAIVTLCESVRGNRSDARQLAARASQIFLLLKETTREASFITPTVLDAITAIDHVLKEVVDELNQILSFGTLSWILSKKKHRSKISELTQRLSNALTDFQLSSVIRIQSGQEEARQCLSRIESTGSEIKNPAPFVTKLTKLYRDSHQGSALDEPLATCTTVRVDAARYWYIGTN